MVPYSFDSQYAFSSEAAAQKMGAVFLILLVFAFTVAAGWWVLQAPVGFLARRMGTLRNHFFPGQEFSRQILDKSFAYYRQLKLPDKLRFEKRVRGFLADKEFIPRGGLVVTDEVKTLVAACAVQLTFGLPPVQLRHFRKIILYPNAYFSTLNRTYHQGEVNVAGAIVLSWKHFTQGYLTPNDSRNVGLHEMAHALLIENRTRSDGEYGFLDGQRLDHFLHCAEAEYGRMQRGESELLRKYAQTSPAEFFSVSVEVFFENPHALAAGAPLLYDALRDLLRQDPLRLRVGSQA